MLLTQVLDDVIIWILSALLVLCEGNHRLSVDAPHKGPAMQGFDVIIAVNHHEQCVEQTVCLVSPSNNMKQC